jgi:hypothetical protein
MAKHAGGRAVRRGLVVMATIAAGLAVAADAASAIPPGQARLTIRKVTVGADGNFEFAVTGAQGVEVALEDDSIETIGGVADQEIVVDVPPGTYTITEDPDDGPNDAFELTATCTDGSQSDGSSVNVSLLAGQDVVCTFTNRATLAMSKTVTGISVVQAQTGQYDVAYRVTATNTLTVERGVALLDRFFLPEGVTAVGAATVTNLVNIDAPTVGWTGFEADEVGETNLAAGETASFDVTVRLAVAAGATPEVRDCVGIDEFGTGSANAAFGVVTRGVAAAVACSPLSSLTLVAQVINDNGGTLVPSGITLNALNATTTAFTGTGTVRGWIGTEALTIAGADVPNYTRRAFVCTGATLSGATVTVAPGTDATCVIVYDDVAVVIAPASTTTTTVRAVASTLPPTGSGQGTSGFAGVGVALLGAGALLVLLAGQRRRAGSR